MQKVIIPILFILILSMGMTPVFAEFHKPDHITYRAGWNLTHNPTACIMEPHDKGANFLFHEENFEINMRSAANHWNAKLRVQSDNYDEWKTNFKTYPKESWSEDNWRKEHRGCDVYIFTEQYTRQRLAGTVYSVNDGKPYHVLTIFMLSIRGLEPDENGMFDVKLRPYQATHHVMEHEWGHVMGLGHYLTDPMPKPGGIYQSKLAEQSVMWAQASFWYDEYHIIRPLDIDALLELYKHDGFGGSNEIQFKYIVPIV